MKNETEEKPKTAETEQKPEPSEVFEENWNEIKSTWREHRGEMSLKDIFCRHLIGKVFPIEKWHRNGSYWMTFLARAAHWEKKLRAKELKEEADNITDEEVLEIQDRNRRMMIILLREALRHYQEDPSAFKKLTVNKINKLYKTVQQAEEAAKRTRIKMGKLKVDAAKTFFPYQRMSVKQLEQLKEDFNEGIGEVLRLKKGESVEPGSAGTG